MINYSYNELICCCANHAEVPGIPALRSLANSNCMCELKSCSCCSANQSQLSCWVKLLITIFGFFILKIFNHITSKIAQKKNPIANVAIPPIMDLPIVSGAINGIPIQQIKNLIKRILGKFLAYSNNCSEFICHSSGTVLGKVVQISSLLEYKIKSKIKATVGYNTKPNAGIATNHGPLPKQILINIANKLAITNFNPMAIIPDLAITFGLLKKVFNSIRIYPYLINDLFNLKIAHNQLKQYTPIPQSINPSMFGGQQYVV